MSDIKDETQLAKDELRKLQESIKSRALSHGLTVEFSEDGQMAIFANEQGERQEISMTHLAQMGQIPQG